MKTLDEIRRWAESHTDICLDIVRVYIGIGLFVKAIGFIGDKQYLMNLMSGAGDLWFAPVMIIHYVIFAHLVGGLMLAAGLMSRIAAAVQIPVLMGAVFYVNLPRVMAFEFRQNLEFSALMLLLLCVIAVFGPGRWSSDFYLFRRTNSE